MIYDATNSSNYMVFADEAGDHNLTKWDPNFPLFVMAFCIIEKKHYCNYILPKINLLKLKYFNRTDIILHERDIRKQSGVFSCLVDKAIHNQFMEDLTTIIKKAQFVVVCCVIDKQRLKSKYKNPAHPYHLGTGLCLERLSWFLSEHNEKGKLINITFEARGKNEDDALKENFKKTCESSNINITITPKINNCVGLQFADLIARPIGRHVLNPQQKNRSFDVIEDKFRKDDQEDYMGRGLKIFP